MNHQELMSFHVSDEDEEKENDALLNRYTPIDSWEQFTPRVEKVWKKYFKTTPPGSGSDSEERLVKTCISYINSVLGPGNSGSDPYQRKIHNDLAFMVFGRARSGMDFATADRLANFASEIVLGMSLDEVDDKFFKQ